MGSKGEVRYLPFISTDNFNAIHTVELCISAIYCVKSELLNKVYVRHFSNLIKSVLKVNQESGRKGSFKTICFICLLRVVGVKNEFV